MRTMLIAAGVIAALASPSAFAQDGDADGTAAGAVGGAAVGAVVGGPIGALIGAGVGAAAGNAIDDPDEDMRAYVVQQEVPSVTLSGDLQVGACLPEDDRITLYEVPNSQYRLVRVNDRNVLVDPGTRCIVYLWD